MPAEECVGPRTTMTEFTAGAPGAKAFWISLWMATFWSHTEYCWTAGAPGLTMLAFINTQALTKFSRSVADRNLAFLRTA